MNSLAQLTDDSLHSETKRLVGSSNTLTAQLLAHLGEVEARGIHRERACSSLYTYCVYELRMSEDEAQRRCRAARLARQFPTLLEMVAEASLHLTGILLIGPHLTNENCAELLARVRFRTKREIEQLIAEIAPCQDVPSKIVPLTRASAGDWWMVSPLDDHLPRPRNTWAAYVRGLAGDVRQLEAGLGAGQAPPRVSNEEVASATGGRASSGEVHDGETGVRTPAIDERQNLSKPPRSGEVQPTASVPTGAELRYRVQFTADQAYVELLEEARNLLQHELPSRDLAAVQRRALELLVQKLRQRKYAASAGPRAKASEPVSGTSPSQSTPAPPPAPPSATGAPHSPPRAGTAARQPVPSQVTDARHCASQSAPRSLHPAPHSKTHARHSALQPASQGRYIPAEVRRSVWKRDEARCAYVDARGQRCREQSGLEFHHQHPHGRGGPPSFDNIALRCRSHNDLAAEQDFGRDVIREKKRARRAAGAEATRAGAAP